MPSQLMALLHATSPFNGSASPCQLIFNLFKQNHYVIHNQPTTLRWHDSCNTLLTTSRHACNFEQRWFLSTKFILSTLHMSAALTFVHQEAQVSIPL